MKQPAGSILETARLILREFEVGDAAAVQVYAGNPEVTRYTSWGPNSPEMTELVLRGWQEERARVPRVEWPLAIVRRSDGILIGGTGIGLVDWGARKAIFGYVLRREAWGRGYATEAGRAVLAWAFGELGLQRLMAHCEPAHVASRRVLEKLGFRAEPELVSLPRIDGERREYLTYSR